ncbi:MAG TPA: transglutaminase domain-containing protein [Pirellulaceae bacterium]|nr:transglutaminase domain-containing protein [Pirellulaceae bacterium]
MTLRRVSLVRYIAFTLASVGAALLQSGIMGEGQGGGATCVWAADADPVAAALERAGGNRAEIAGALERAPAEHRDSMRFLIENMPDRDLKELKAEFLLENVRLAHEALDKAPWKASMPREVFLNNVLPYANINERRDDWRADFIKRFGPLVAEAKTPGQAAAILNQKIFGMVNVRYSTGRPKADQSPFESMKAGLASCSGLTVLLIDACRAVGVPARFVGTPLWSDKSGNHSWVEVWDDGWHFTGAAEPAGDKLDEAWFIGRASTAQRDHRLHAIYAVSFKKTPITFPLVWDRSIDYVHAVNVTDRYAGKAVPLADGFSAVMFKVVDGAVGNRCAAKLTVRDAAGKVVFEGTSKDERFDANDHVTVPLKAGEKYQVEAQSDSGKKSTAVAEPDVGKKANGVVTIKLDP